MNIAIVGYGSIGKRHEKNCLKLGHKVDVLSQHLKRKLRRDEYDLVIICSKTSKHLFDVKKFINLSDNFLIEKPLGVNYKDAMKIKKLLRGKKIRVGYCLIFNPVILKVKELIGKKIIGDIYFAQIYAGSHLPNWRKGEDYSERYSAKPREGGGVALDLIHEVNFTQFFFPEKITSIHVDQGKISNLKIKSRDFAHFLIRQEKRFITITLNYFQLFPERFIKLAGSKGTIFADLLKSKVEVFDEKNKKVLSRVFDFDYNEMYIDEIQSMERYILGRETNKVILSVDQGISDLKIVGGKVN